MNLHWIDGLIIAVSILFSMLIALYYRKKAERGFEAFFLGGRNLPWYLAGVSMVATTFAADTPLAVTEIVAKNGVSGNWLWWNFMIGGMLTAFFFANLWRRSGVFTEAEFIELRYGGKPAAFLRGFKAFYLGIFINVLIMGWVCKAMMTLLEVFFDLNTGQSLAVVGALVVLVMIYANIGGLTGVAVTDFFQFFLAMTGCTVLAILVLSSEKIGGAAGLVEKLPDGALNFFPVISSQHNGSTLDGWSFLAFFGMMWWASWYPGAEPGGGGYVAQRMMSTKSEKDAFKATLFFQIGHYALRPWPWIIVGLAAIVLYPELGADDKKMGYVMAMREFLPAGLRGLMLAAFLAAFMSTISTQLNWGAGYVVNDLWLRFSKKTYNDREIVLGSRVTGLLLSALTIIVSSFITTITGVWEFILQCGAGLGLVLILRWYWWRINAKAEIAATVSPFIIYALIKLMDNQSVLTDDYRFWLQFPGSFFVTVTITTFSWLIVCLSTEPESVTKLQTFWQRVKPGGCWPQAIKASETQIMPLKWLIPAWLSALAMTYAVLFLIGSWVLGLNQWSIWLGISIAGGISTWYFSRKVGLM